MSANNVVDCCICDNIIVGKNINVIDDSVKKHCSWHKKLKTNYEESNINCC